MTVPAFTVRDLTWRSLAEARPEDGTACIVDLYDNRYCAHFSEDEGAWLVLTQMGHVVKWSAYPEDLWRLEDER